MCTGPAVRSIIWCTSCARMPDFVPELAFVLELDGELIGNVMYTKASLLDGAGGEKPILTFGRSA